MQEHAEVFTALYREFADTLTDVNPRVHGYVLHVSRQSVEHATRVAYRMEYDDGRSWDIGCTASDSSVRGAGVARMAHVVITELLHLAYNTFVVPQRMN